MIAAVNAIVGALGLAVIALVFLMPIWAILRAFTDRDFGWAFGMIFALLIGFAWIPAAIYLWTHRDT